MDDMIPYAGNASGLVTVFTNASITKVVCLI